MAKKKKRVAKKKKRAGRTGRVGRPPKAALGDVSTNELQRELDRRRQQIDRLIERRERLAGEVAELDREIGAFEGTAGAAPARRGRPPAARSGARRGPGRPRGSGKGRRRPRNEMNLADALVGVLQGQTMSVTEAAEAVQKAGYKTTSKTFRTIVNQTLLRDSRIKKVSRGQYTAA